MRGFARFVGRTASRAWHHPIPTGKVWEQAWFIGVKAMPILLTMTAFIGSNLALQGYYAFKALGGQSLLGMFVSLAGVREMAPLMVAAMTAAKAGTEMASQLAVMRIREQIDALEVMSIDPYTWLVVPRCLGILIALPALTMMCILTLIGTAWLVTMLQLGESGPQFLHTAFGALTGQDLWIALFKAAVFGLLISLISCYCGFRSKPGPRGVGDATNAAVVTSAVVCAVVNYLISEWMYA